MIQPNSVYGKLTAISNVVGGRWLFRCECGKEKVCRRKDVVAGRTKSCGCIRVAQIVARNTKHGGYARDSAKQDPLLGTWRGMVNRVTNPKSQSYKYYGARGVYIYEAWIKDFGAFRDWILNNIGPKPSSGHTLDRIDGRAGYEPGNLRWATYVEQSNNRRSCMSITHDGKTQTLMEWCRELGVSYALAQNRITNLGWDASKAITTPAFGHQQSKE